jgi:hypothetical protein
MMLITIYHHSLKLIKEELRSDSLEEDISIPMVVVWECRVVTYLLHVLFAL